MKITYDRDTQRWGAYQGANRIASSPSIGRLLGKLSREGIDAGPDAVQPFGSRSTCEAIAAYREARSRYDTASRDASTTLRRALSRCLAEGYSLRDAAIVLGVTHQRAHQVITSMAQENAS